MSEGKPRKRLKKAPAKAEPEEKPLPRGSVRMFQLNEGLPNISKINEELLDMVDVLMGRVAPPAPLRGTTLALLEVADAYYARASEIKMQIQKLEREGRVIRGAPLYKLRTGELATFMEMAKRASELGSRRLTDESLAWDQEKYGRESG